LTEQKSLNGIQCFLSSQCFTYLSEKSLVAKKIVFVPFIIISLLSFLQEKKHEGTAPRIKIMERFEPPPSV